ncbi:hypothetical protein [Fuscibacter oryzae]|uniref:50S ribosomal protein L35 n=1 Tax=Fuscibacter oryzae TaxID=2803939 RepID=A0A8J7MRH9_9RHOB|nr:hypothetical protein [Fuscibacter oryzae]MBL4927008.1 hypothetical protein [Fuscibacter oryzae]
MDTDLILVVGIVVSALTFPALLAAFSESRPPRAASVILLVGGVLIVYALTQKPTGYSFGEIPDVFVRVFRRVLG